MLRVDFHEIRETSEGYLSSVLFTTVILQLVDFYLIPIEEPEIVYRVAFSLP